MENQKNPRGLCKHENDIDFQEQGGDSGPKDVPHDSNLKIALKTPFNNPPRTHQTMVRKTDLELPDRLPNWKRDIGRNLSNKDNTKYNKKHQPEGIHANHRYDGRIRHSGKELGVSKHPLSSSSKLRQEKFRNSRKHVR